MLSKLRAINDKYGLTPDLWICEFCGRPSPFFVLLLILIVAIALIFGAHSAYQITNSTLAGTPSPPTPPIR